MQPMSRGQKMTGDSAQQSQPSHHSNECQMSGKAHAPKALPNLGPLWLRRVLPHFYCRYVGGLRSLAPELMKESELPWPLAGNDNQAHAPACAELL